MRVPIPLHPALLSGAVSCLLVLQPASGFAQAPPGGGPPPTVTVQTVATRDVAPRPEFIGRLEAMQAVDVRARVQGFLREVLFREGQDVKAGDPLFAIEDDVYQALQAQSQAQLESAQATLRNADLNLQRRQELFQRNAGSQADLDAAVAARDTAQASVAAAEAQLKSAQLNVGFTRIVSPIAGRIGKANVTRGNLVGPDSGVLARVVQLDPIQVVFSVSERDVIDVVQKAPRDASQQELAASFVPTLRLSTGETFDEKGSIAFVGNEVDPTTGTVPIRATFPNPRTALLPGGTVYVTVRPAAPRVLPVVPVGAVQETRQGRSVLVVTADNKVEERPIQTSTQVGQDYGVESGLQAGETIIVEGLQKVRPGSVVNPVRATAQPAASAAAGPAPSPAPAQSPAPAPAAGSGSAPAGTTR